MKHKKKLSGLAYVLIAVAVLFSLLPGPLLVNNSKVHAQTVSVGPNEPGNISGNCATDGGANGVGTQAWGTPQNAAIISGSASDNVRATSAVTTANRTTHYLICDHFGFNIPSSAVIVGIVLGLERSVATNNTNTVTDNSIKLVKAGAVSGNSITTGTQWPITEAVENHGSSTNLWGLTWTPADINATNFGAAVSAAEALFQSNNNTARVDTMTITVTYSGVPQLRQRGYIWENDDEDQATGDVYDENSQQAAGNTAISNVAKGERLTLRLQVDNPGATSITQGFSLFYDKNDGNFRKVGLPKPIPAAGSGCAASGWSCSALDAPGTAVNSVKIGVGQNGNPYVLYTDTSLRIYSAEYVGSGGTGCSGTSAWTACEIVATGLVGINSPFYHVGISTGPNGHRYALYYINGFTWDQPELATYVGPGNGSGCTSNAWTCTTISTPNGGTNASQGPAELTATEDGNIYALVEDGQGASAKQYLCINTGSWSCSLFTDPTATSFASLNQALGGTTQAVTHGVSYFGNSSSDLVYATYVSSGGSCSTNAAWDCTTVDATGTVGNYSSLAYSPDGTPYISYYDTTNGDLKVAYYVGGASGNCNSTGGSSDWQCTTVDNGTTLGQYTSLVFSPRGIPYVTYYDGNGSNQNLKLAYYDGTWNTSNIETTNNVGKYSSLAFDFDGNPYVAYYDTTNTAVRIATQPLGGEISLSQSPGLNNGDSLNESHTDMSSISDTSNRDDADCISGNTWSNGKVFSVDEPSSLTLAGGSCTEIGFVLDTSQAVASTTYRFILVSDSGFDSVHNRWQGPITIDQYATLTVASSTILRANKATEPELSGCAAASWTCGMIDGTSTDVGQHSSMAFSPDGTAYIAYYDNTTGNKDLKVAQYVGTGGSGCATGVVTWTCTLVDALSSDIGQYTSITFTNDGTPYISYYDVTNTSLRVAFYDGDGTASGCTGGSVAWTCTTVDNTATSTGLYTSIAAGRSNEVYVSYYDSGNHDLKVAKYPGTGNDNCTDTTWDCYAVESTNDVGQYSSMAMSQDGTPYISYYDLTNGNLRVAQYVSFGGSGCARSSWKCTLVEATTTGTNDVGKYTSIAFNGSGVPYISYYDASGTALRVAFYDGDASASGCTGGSAAWTCTAVDNTATDTGQYSSIAFSPAGTAYVSYYDTTPALKVAQYVGGSGTCTDTNWSCSQIDTTGGPGQYSSLAFSPTGVPFVAYYNASTSNDLKVAKLAASVNKPLASSLFSIPGRNGRWESGLYNLADGRSPRTNNTGDCRNAVSSFMGLCGIYDNNGDTDAITAQINERPIFTFSQSFTTNTILPTAAWAGGSTLAPNTAGTAGDIKLQVYKFGTTNAWQDVASNSTSATCTATDNCLVNGIPSGTISDYFESDGGGNYWMYWRVYQVESASSAETLSTDLFQLQFIDKQMRHGKLFENNVKRAFTF